MTLTCGRAPQAVRRRSLLTGGASSKQTGPPDMGGPVRLRFAVLNTSTGTKDCAAIQTAGLKPATAAANFAGAVHILTRQRVVIPNPATALGAERASRMLKNSLHDGARAFSPRD